MLAWGWTLWSCLLAVGLYLLVGAAVLASRARHERRHRLLQRLLRLAPVPAAESGPAGGDRDRVREVLQGARRSQVERLAAEVDLPPHLATWVSEHLAETRRLDRLRLDATAPGGRNPWVRIAALRVLAQARPAEARLPLGHAIADADPEVRGAAITILGGIAEPWAAKLLVRALRKGSHARSRIATVLDGLSRPSDELLLPLLDDPEPQARYWGAVLLRRYRDLPGLAFRLARLSQDPEPQVRKAALASLATVGGPEAVAAAKARLDDPVFYVRAHAVRALGQLGAATAADAIAAKLSDQDWWVRYAAKRALEAFGPAAEPAARARVDDADAFARNGAAEVLQNLGAFERLVAAEVGDAPDPQRAALLRALADAGGLRMWEAQVSRLAPESRSAARALLSRLGLETPRIAEGVGA